MGYMRGRNAAAARISHGDWDELVLASSKEGGGGGDFGCRVETGEEEDEERSCVRAKLRAGGEMC
jgi:hypothetical protein